MLNHGLSVLIASTLAIASGNECQTTQGYLIAEEVCGLDEIDQFTCYSNSTISLYADPDPPLCEGAVLLPDMHALDSIIIENMLSIEGTLPASFSDTNSLQLINLPNLHGEIPGNMFSLEGKLDRVFRDISFNASTLALTGRYRSITLKNIGQHTWTDVYLRSTFVITNNTNITRVDAIDFTVQYLDMDEPCLDYESSNITIPYCAYLFALRSGESVLHALPDVQAKRDDFSCPPIQKRLNDMETYPPIPVNERTVNFTGVRMKNVYVPASYCLFNVIVLPNNTGSFRVEDNNCNLEARLGRAIRATTQETIEDLVKEAYIPFTVLEEEFGQSAAGYSRAVLNVVVFLGTQPLKSNPQIADRLIRMLIMRNSDEPFDPSELGHVAFNTTVVGNFEGCLPPFFPQAILRLVNTGDKRPGRFNICGARPLQEGQVPSAWLSGGEFSSRSMDHREMRRIDVQPHASFFGTCDVRETGLTGNMERQLCVPGFDGRNNNLRGIVPKQCYENAERIKLSGNCWTCCDGSYPFSGGAPTIKHPTADWANTPCCEDRSSATDATCRDILACGADQVYTPSGCITCSGKLTREVRLLCDGLCAYSISDELVCDEKAIANREAGRMVGIAFMVYGGPMALTLGALVFMFVKY